MAAAKKKKKASSPASTTPAVKGRERPLSPHLQVYKPQITSVLSITHRASAVVLFLTLPLFVLWLSVAAFWDGCFDCTNAMLGSIIGRAALFVITYALFYNMLHGIRHTFWDYVIGFELKTVNITAWLIVFGALLLTLATWWWAYGL